MLTLQLLALIPPLEIFVVGFVSLLPIALFRLVAVVVDVPEPIVPLDFLREIADE